jgi:hypothetical protein
MAEQLVLKEWEGKQVTVVVLGEGQRTERQGGRIDKVGRDGFTFTPTAYDPSSPAREQPRTVFLPWHAVRAVVLELQ